MRLFQPHLHYKSFQDIDLDLLLKKGYTNLFFDVDNTLVAHDVALATTNVIEFFSVLKKKGFNVYLISNNSEERVKKFAKSLDVPCFWFAMKPLKRTFRKIIKQYKIDPNTIAMIGDQLLTDVLGANRLGLFVIYTQPLVSKDISFTRFNRIIEARIIKRLTRKGRLEKGVLYE